MADEQYTFIIHSCILYSEKASGIVVDVYLECGVVREFEPFRPIMCNAMFIFPTP